MNLLNWLSGLTIIVIYWGFAGALGHIFYRLRDTKIEKAHLFWLCVSGLGFGLQTLALPFPIWQQIAIITIAFLITVIFAQHPVNLPAWLWSDRFGMRYISFAMLLGIIWSLSRLPLILALSISACALLAGIYTWQRSLESN